LTGKRVKLNQAAAEIHAQMIIVNMIKSKKMVK